MKKLLLLSAAIAAMTISAHAGLQPLNLGTNTVAGSSATNFSSIGTIVTTTSQDITLQVSSISTAADTAVKTWVFNGSVDNTIWTTNVLVISYAATGTAVNSGITNLPAGYRYPFLQPFYMTNAAATATATNLTVKAFIKPGI